MKCPKCGSEAKPNYKFCTKCGQPMTTDETTPAKQQETKNVETFAAKSFNAPNDENLVNKSRQSREEKPEEKPDEQPVSATNVAENIDLVKGKATWNMAPGQLARKITESEFAQLDKVDGVLIDDGVTAIVTVDGQFMGMLSGGSYEFASKTVKEKANAQADKEEKDEEEDASFFQKAGKVAKRVWRFLTGTQKKEKAEARKKRRERVKRNIQRITANSTVKVSLVSNRHFELLFGSKTDANGITEFVPMTVKAKVVDLEMGVRLQMQITNVNDFLVNYLADKNSFSIVDAQRLVQPSIENLLNRMLRNLDYQAEGLPEELIGVIKSQIQKTVNERVFGLEVTQVLDITDQSADFERFRSVEHELFASEQELGYLQRTGEFRNRLAEETNRQTVNEAKSEEDLRYALSKINQDGLLHDDEMEAFVELLDSQKRLREAKTEEQEYEALQDLRKCRLVKDEDVAVLEDLLARKELERSEVTELLRLRVFQSTEEARLKAENALNDLALQHQFNEELSTARHDIEMTDLELQAQRKRDEYAREQGSLDYDMEHRQKVDEMTLEQQKAEFEHQQRRAEKMDDVDVLERKAAISMANMEKIQALERAKMEKEHEHEQRMHEMDVNLERNRDNQFATMTAEQIRAAQLSHLDATAQAEMARSYGSDKENELLKQQQEREHQLYQQMLQMMQQNQQMMKDGMIQMGQNAMANQQAMFSQQSTMQQQRIEEVEKMKNEYRDTAIHQQERTDRTQDSALNYTTRVTESSQESNPTITVKTTASVQPVFCPNCGGKATTADKVCPHCGEPLEE